MWQIADIPGVSESGWVPGQQSSETEVRGAQSRKLHQLTATIALRYFVCGLQTDRLLDTLDALLQAIKRHSYAWPFKEAVDRSAVPQYYKVITDPIDLSMIEDRLKSKTYYVTRDLFVADLRRMLQNCKAFNDAQSSYYKCATALEAFIEERLKKL